MDGEHHWVEYGRGLCTAEEAVSATIDQILTDGGMLLWQKYLERKAFSFAATAITEALVSRLRMCYVHHDHGEALHDGELGEEWQIEEEPGTCEVDSWARMHLPVRRGKNEEANTSTGPKAPKLRRAPASRAKFSSAAQTKVAEFQPRIQPLEAEVHVDPEEERMREAKAQEEAKKRDKERAAKESEKTLEEERRKVQQLHEEMSKRPHTFDTEGNLIWVDELKPDRLPRLVESFSYAVKKDPKLTGTLGREDKPVMGGAGASSVTDKRAKRQKGAGKRRRGEAGPEFTDGFSKLQHGQPPIIETMVLVPGVLLEQMGKVKSGPEPAERFMSRKEYVLLAEAEVPTDASFRKGAPAAASSTDQGPPGGDPPASAGGGAAPGGAPPEATGLPQIPAGRVTAVPAYPGQPKPGAATSQKAPPAPPAPVRRKYEALGFGRDPRYHAPNLGGNLGLGAAQPVLGATMGHGLVKSSSNKEAFFFPAAVPDLPGVLRSQSEAALGSARRGPTETTPRGPDDQGQLRPELSPAYRNFRHAMNLDGGLHH